MRTLPVKRHKRSIIAQLEQLGARPRRSLPKRLRGITVTIFVMFYGVLMWVYRKRESD